MSSEDDPLVFPWEEGVPPPRPQVGVPPARVGRKTRRSSILKQPSSDAGPDRTALQVQPALDVPNSLSAH